MSANPAVGIGFRLPIKDWTLANLSRFDVLEITVDHYIHGGAAARRIMRDLVGQVDLVAHGVGLSIGTDCPLDQLYLDQVAETLEDLKCPFYSEHLALTKVPGIDLANLLPIPKNEEVAAKISKKIEKLRSTIKIPFYLENITYIFDYPDSTMNDAEFFNLLNRETNVGIHLDVENLFLNAKNMNVDAVAFLDALPVGIVKCIHVAGGAIAERDFLDVPVWTDGHDYPVPDEALDLLVHALKRQTPETIVLERDERLTAFAEKDDPNAPPTEEILRDLQRIRSRIVEAKSIEASV